MMRELIGQELGKYRLIHLLGQGGFAEVYLGQHIYLKSEAAIKILHTRMTREQVLGFLQEAQVIARLIHPNIVRVLDFDVANNGLPFLVMDYCPHGTLRERHANAGPLPLETVLSYVEQVAPALHYAHENKLIHRDIKPENMLIGSQNQILLSDFGIASSAHSTSSMSAQIPIGTIYYMAPEQIQAQARPASDQYALGITVYEWLCGERPFTGSYTEIFAKHIMTPPPPLRTKVPTLPPLVEEVVLKALAKDPHERFATMQAFAMALRQAAQSAGVTSISSQTIRPGATQPPQLASGGLAPAATVTPNVITPPASIGIPPTQLPVMGMARAGEAQTDLPPLPAYPGQKAPPAQPARPTPSAPGQQIGPGLAGVGEAHTDLPPLPSYPGQAMPLASIDTSAVGAGASLPATQPVQSPQTSRRTMLTVLGTVALIGGGLIGLEILSHAGTSNSPTTSDTAATIPTEVPTPTDIPTPTPTPSPFGTPLIFTGHNNSELGVLGMAWSPDGNYICAGIQDGALHGIIHVLNASNEGVVSTYQGHIDGGIYGVCWSPDSQRIASASDDGTVQIWNALTAGNLLVYKGHNGTVEAVKWSPDGQRIASCSNDKTVQVWDASSGNQVFTYTGHTDPVTTIAWSPDSKRIASGSVGSSDQALHVWHVGDKNNVITYTYTPDALSFSNHFTVIWSPDGKHLAWTEGKNVQVYHAP